MPATLSLGSLSAVWSHRFSDESARFLRHPSSDCANRRRVSVRAVAAEAVESRRTAAASLYEVLRVEHDASPTEIKSAYRSLAKLYHPDAAAKRSPLNDDGDFIEIRNAYETLSDPSARAMYDLSLTAAHGGKYRRFPSPLTQNRYSGFYTTRRWETDQCW